MPFEKVWVEQWRATKAIKRRFSTKSAVDHLIGEKLISFLDAAAIIPHLPELPKFLAVIWQTFDEHEIAGYIASRKRAARNRLDSFDTCAESRASSGRVAMQQRGEIASWRATSFAEAKG